MEKFSFNSLYAESMKQPRVNTYGGYEVAEYEVVNSYAEFMSVAFGMSSDIAIYCEQAQQEYEEHGILKAFLYAEAEGGFFKKILNALIKVYTKAKDFVVKLLGRVKSDKAYRQDLTYLESIIKSAVNVTFTDNASITIKKSRYVPIAAIVIGIMKENSILLEVAEGKDGVTVDGLNEKLKSIISKFETEKVTDEIQAVKTNLDKMRNDYPTKEQWLKSVYDKCISQGTITGDKNIGDADFGKNSAGTALEAVNKLWETNTRVLKGDKDIKAFLNDQFRPIFGDSKGISYDAISKSLEKGVTELSDKIDDLKGLLKEVEASATRANNATGDGKEIAKGNATAASSMAMNYSQLMSTYTVVVTEGFNTAKIQLDRLIAEFKAYATAVDKVRKENASSTTAGVEPKPAAQK